MAKLRKLFGKRNNRNLDPQTLNQALNIATAQPQYQTGQDIIDSLNFIAERIAETEVGLSILKNALQTENNEAIYTVQESLNKLREEQQSLLRQPFLKGVV